MIINLNSSTPGSIVLCVCAYCRSKVNASSLAGCQVLHAAPLWRLTHPLTPASQSNTLTVKSFWVPSDLNHQVFSWNTLGNRNILFVAFVYTTSQGTSFYKNVFWWPWPWPRVWAKSRSVGVTHSQINTRMAAPNPDKLRIYPTSLHMERQIAFCLLDCTISP